MMKDEKLDSPLCESPTFIFMKLYSSPISALEMGEVPEGRRGLQPRKIRTAPHQAGL